MELVMRIQSTRMMYPQVKRTSPSPEHLPQVVRIEEPEVDVESLFWPRLKRGLLRLYARIEGIFTKAPVGS